MKIRCPKCKHVISLGISKLPSTGIEVQCTSCSAKFRLRSKGGDSPEAPPAEPSPTPAAPQEFPPIGGESPSSDIFGGSPLGMDDELAAAPPESPAAPAGGGALDGLADLLQELDDMPESDNASSSMFQVRGQKGNVFGPFDAPTILGMLDNGQLTGVEDLSQDGNNWQHIGEWPDFAEKVANLQAAAPPPPAVEESVSWEDEASTPPPVTADAAAPTLEEPPVPGVPIDNHPSAVAAGPIETSSVVEEEVAIRRVERKAPQRIRSALKDEVMEAESGKSMTLEAVKENLQAIDKKYFIMGGAGLGLIVVLSFVAMWLLSGPGKKAYSKVTLNLEPTISRDSYPGYTRKLLPRIAKGLKKEPGHPQLLAYKVITLGMYLEHYGPNKSLAKQMALAVKKLPKPSKKYKPTLVETWARATQAMTLRRSGPLQKHLREMQKKARGHFILPYLGAKVLLFRGRYKAALKTLNQAAGKFSSPARVNFAKAEVYLRMKKMERACRSYYQTTLVNKGHLPAYLALLQQEEQCSKYIDVYDRLWKESKRVLKYIKSAAVKSRYAHMQAMRAARLDQPNKALRFLLTAIRLQPNKTYVKKLPTFYLNTYDYTRITRFLTKMFKRSGNFDADLVSAYLQVKYRTRDTPTARRRLAKLMKRCKACAQHHDLWIWKALIEASNNLENKAVNSLNHALNLQPGSVAALANKARIAWNANHPKITKKILKALDDAKVKASQMKAQEPPPQPRLKAPKAPKGKKGKKAKKGKKGKKARRPKKTKVVLPLPKTVLDYISLSELYFTLKRPKDALKSILKANKKQPRDEYINRLTGTAYLQLENYTKAEEHYRKALKTWNKDSKSIQGLAESLSAQKKYKEAIPYFIDAVKTDPNDANNNFGLGRMYYMTKKYKLALQYIKQGLERNEKNAEAHYYAALTLEALGDTNFNRIEEHIVRATTLEPTNLKYLFKLARLYMKNRQTKKALRIYYRLLRKRSLSKEQKLEILLERGKLHYDMKFWRLALKDFRKLQRLDPKNTIMLRWIADCYRQMNRRGQAVTWYQRALRDFKKRRPETPEKGIVTPELQKWKQKIASIYERLGDLEKTRGRNRQAIRWFTQAVKFNPDNYHNYRSLGYLYKDRRSYSRCITFFKKYLKLAPAKDFDRPEVQRDLSACKGSRY
ncbi:MAG: tetratricopeptide repeat protein [Deltaproteobacteria bacterium]|nr:MAG: tetratricopeptide repeat protein [Deltaproteobacteria bacterium]